MPNVKEREDNERPAEVRGSGDPDLQQEAREAAIERVGESTYYGEPDRFWTAQQGPMPESAAVAARGPQVYLPSQLPDPAIARSANFTPQEIPENIVVNPGAAWSHPRGPEPAEQVRLLKSEAVQGHMVQEARDHPSQKGLFALTDTPMEEIRQAQETPDRPADDAHTSHEEHRHDSDGEKRPAEGDQPEEGTQDDAQKTEPVKE